MQNEKPNTDHQPMIQGDESVALCSSACVKFCAADGHWIGFAAVAICAQLTVILNNN